MAPLRPCGLYLCCMASLTVPDLAWEVVPLLPETADSPLDLVESYARMRGASTPEQIDQFLSPRPGLINQLLGLPGLRVAVERVANAIAAGETITIFGDYDADGITSSVIVRDVLLAAGVTPRSLWCYIPDRFTEDYGLSMKAAAACLERQHPSLIIAVDCGSNSFESIEWLKERGVDVIVIDHHSVVAPPRDRHPALAHLNPKAEYGTNPNVSLEATTLSAAGLCFFFAEMLADTLKITSWEDDRAIVLAGLGTLIDVMPLVGTNRGLVQHALVHGNDPRTLKLMPGLDALAVCARLTRFTAYSFGFTIGPCLNASGRMEHARFGVQLLSARTLEKARPIAEHLMATNHERKQLQEGILEEAIADASQLLESNPDIRVLFLARETWHPGIVGIVAGRIREMFHRPAIVAGRLDDGFWKGSARSVPGFDIGALVVQAVGAGTLTGGGGHAAAAGVKFTNEQHPSIQSWIDTHTQGLQIESVIRYPVLAEADALPTDEVAEVMEVLSPFGNGNPRPHFSLKNAKLVWGPKDMMRRDGTVWGVKAGFQSRAGLMYLTWNNLDKASELWKEGATYRFVLDFNRNVTPQGVYDEWRVLACAAEEE